MGQYESDSNSNNEWEDSWEADWSEFNWERYLQEEENEVAKYQTLYSKLIRSSNRLDEVALYMGWQAGRDSDDEGSQSRAVTPGQERPYTLHRHPIFVSSKALHGWLIEKWGQHVSLCAGQCPARQALEFQSALADSDYHGLLAVTALEVDDYALAIAYFKRGMVSINKAFSLLNDFESQEIEPLNLYMKQARIRLFDIREIWLRVSSDCRATISRGSEED